MLLWVSRYGSSTTGSISSLFSQFLSMTQWQRIFLTRVLKLTNPAWQFRVDPGALLPLLRIHHWNLRRPFSGGREWREIKVDVIRQRFTIHEVIYEDMLWIEVRYPWKTTSHLKGLPIVGISACCWYLHWENNCSGRLSQHLIGRRGKVDTTMPLTAAHVLREAGWSSELISAARTHCCCV